MKTSYFSFKEFIYSEKARTMGISNIPNFEQIKNIILLKERVLEKVRIAIGVPIFINSGYRTIALNNLVGGVNTSQHLFGKAADITTKDKYKDAEMYSYIITHIEFDQLIRYDNFIHVSYSEGHNRGMIIDKRENRRF